MNRRRFLGLLGLAPLLPIASKLRIPSPTGFSLAMLQEAKRLLDLHDRCPSIQTASIGQKLDCLPMRCHAHQATTWVDFGHRGRFFVVTLYDEQPSAEVLRIEREQAWDLSVKRCIAQDRWARKAKAALARSA